MKSKKTDHATLVKLERADIRLRDRRILSDTSLEIKKNQHWTVIGPNGAGKSSFARALAGELPVVSGSLTFPVDAGLKDRTAYVSFEQRRRLIAREERRDAARYFSGRTDRHTTAAQLLQATGCPAEAAAKHFGQIVAQLEIEPLLHRAFRFLSTGEIRKVLIARALMRSPQLLILDEPFDGLDALSRARLSRVINDLMDRQRQVVLVTHRVAEILPGITHVLGIKAGRVFFKGRRAQMLTPARLKRLYTSKRALVHALLPVAAGVRPPAPKVPQILVAMENVTVKYGNTTVLDNLSWTVKFGENWAIAGPNGSGKTTLLNLIAGDNPQAYANAVYLFGKRRGSGESIWDIKRRIGLVSSEFQVRYRKPVTAVEVVLSGFFDSVGLYRRATAAQQETAGQWLAQFGIAQLAQQSFERLSYGQQRLVLLARCLVKLPPLLILDEPCQGLDRQNRKLFLDIIDRIARQGQRHILYVTHQQAEMPACITHLLRFEKNEAGGYTTTTQAL